MRTPVVMDTNVGVVANGESPQAGPRCQLACIQKIIEIKEDHLLLLDDSNLILKEYRTYFCHSGQPGIGDALFKWLWDHYGDDSFVQCVAITPLADPDRLFVEFPADPTLRGFDRSDQKFVAVAIASGVTPEVLNAVDSGWWNYLARLALNGLTIRHICGNPSTAAAT